MADQTFAVNSGFYDAVNSDRTYSADDMNRPYKRLVSNGVFATPQGNPSTDLQVISAGTGMQIIVQAGEGIFADKWFENPAAINITVPNNTSTVPRFDSVIVQVDQTTSGRVGNIVYRTGTPASNPAAPAINLVTNVTEYRVANIYVAAGANAINQDAITDLRGSSSCPWITALINQVDTSVLFEQYQTAYQNYFNNTTAAFNEYLSEQQSAWQQWFDNLTEELTVDTNVIMLTSNYIPTVSTKTIPIGIPSYDADTDVMMVFVNGLKMTEGNQYTVSGLNLSMKASVSAGQVVNIIVLKSIISADMATTVTMIQNLNTKLATYMADSGWINFTLESGATSFDSTTTPAVRCQYGRVYTRGAVKNVTAVNTVICSLPLAYRPAQNHIFTSSAISNGTVSATITLEVTTGGSIKLIAKSGNIPSTALISIATDWALESESSTGADTSASLIVTDDGDGNVVLSHT